MRTRESKLTDSEKDLIADMTRQAVNGVREYDFDWTPRYIETIERMIDKRVRSVRDAAERRTT